LYFPTHAQVIAWFLWKDEPRNPSSPFPCLIQGMRLELFFFLLSIWSYFLPFVRRAGRCPPAFPSEEEKGLFLFFISFQAFELHGYLFPFLFPLVSPPHLFVPGASKGCRLFPSIAGKDISFFCTALVDGVCSWASFLLYAPLYL